ncbi:MAG: hypothetical protein ACI4JM_05685 [Oscillospiraceae bacterium]
MKLFIDDRVIISEEMKNMSKEQLKAEIEKLEKEAITEKNKILKKK